MWLNLLNVTDKSSIYSCSYIAVHVYIKSFVCLSHNYFLFQKWHNLISENHVFICISWTNAKIIASVNYIHIEWKKYSYFATQREATCSKELFAGENNYPIWYFSLNHKFNQQNHQGDSWEWHPRPRECRNKVGSPSASVLLEGRVHANVVLFG